MVAQTVAPLHLSLKVLGPLLGTIGDEPISESRTKKIEALLVYLALSGDRPIRRENLVGLLFPDMPDEAARTNLRQSLTRLRRAIKDQKADPPFLLMTRESVQFNRASDHFVDAAAFQQLQRGCPNHEGRRDGRCPACMARAQQAIDLYRQPFLDGFFLEDSLAFDEWMLATREQFQEAALALAGELGDYYERRGEYQAAEAVARRQVEMEPWREEAQRLLMRVLAYQGRRGEALRQYERLAEQLATDLGLDPMPATERLRQQIVSAADSRRNNLPARDHSFVGRSDELAMINEHLADPDRRLVNLVGPGGSGKTALAIEMGWRATSLHLGPFIHGVFLVPLANISAPEMQENGHGSTYDPLVTAVADALGFSPTTNPERELVDYLSDKQLLLILDNAEHLIDGVRKLALTCLRDAPNVQMLVTSRTRLNLAEEWLVEVGGLPVPDPATPEAAELADDDAPQLFFQRAQRLVPELTSPEGEFFCPKPAVARICGLVQGLPLGVELAASWVRLLNCEEIATELERNLDFLSSSAAGIERRHQSLRAVFDYSWALLDDADRRTFGRLAVFSGAFDRAAAETVAGANVRSLARLIDYSLLQRRGAGSDQTQRYEILETLRHFAAKKQQAAEEGTDQLKEHYSNYYLDFLATRLADLRGHRQQVAIDEITQEIGNIRTAWRLAAERANLSTLDIAHESLAMFYYVRSWFAEGENSFALASSSLSHGQPDPVRETLWARLTAWQGWFRTLRGQVAEGRQLLQEAAAILRQHGESVALGGMLPYLAVATSSAGDNAAAERLAREAQQIGRQRGDHYIETVSANVLSQILYLQGDYEKARKFGQESLALERQSGNDWSIAFSLVNLGRVAFAEGDYQQASAHYQEAIEIRENLGDARGKALGLLYLGDAALAQGKLAPAQQACQRSLAIFRDIGSRSGSAEALGRLGRIATLEGKPRRARRDYGEALALARAGQAVQPMLEAMLGLARLLADETPEGALLAARVVAMHPAADENSGLEARELEAELASEMEIAQPDQLEPEQAKELLDEAAGRLLQVAHIS